MITHKSYPSGVHSLSFVAEGTDCSIGVIEPGDHSFATDRHEKVQVVLGKLFDLRSGTCFSGQQNTLPPFKPGETVRVFCNEIVVYLCYYSDTPFLE